LLGDPGIWNRVSGYKVASLALFFVVAYATYAIARYGFGASRFISVLAGVTSLLFGAIFPTFWAFGNLTRSSYLGLYSPAGSFYHNATQLFSHGLAATGVALIGVALKQRVKLVALGCLLIAASTFYKPSFILYFVPAMFLLVPVLYLAQRVTRDVIIGLGLLLLAPAAWILYPLLMQVPRVPTTLAIEPFQVSVYWVHQSWNYAFLRSPLALAAFVVAMSFAFPLLTVAFALADPQWRGWWSWARLKQALTGYPFEVLIVVFFGLSVAAGILLVEPNDLLAGNMAWGTNSAYLVALPGLLYLTPRLSSRAARWILWIVFAWQVLSGTRHLIRFVITGQI
jgi:hypothetical protein